MSTVLEEEPPAAKHQKHRRWRAPWPQIIACLGILGGVCLFLYPHAASWFSQKEQSRVIELADDALESPPNNEEEYRTEQLDLAHSYNDALASGAIYRANENIATGNSTSEDSTFDYDELLSFTDNGFMGRLQYDALDIDLPIYHGTSDETLARGIGHLEGTSLPVGGTGTRSVLTAHRGLPEATLFTNLNKAEVGDVFTITILDQVLSYKVTEIEVIDPEETTEIVADPDRDLVTLVTCTPLGINSHRILVTGERITPTPIEEVEAAQADPELPGFPWWMIGLGTAVLFVGTYIWRAGYPRGSRKPEENAESLEDVEADLDPGSPRSGRHRI